MSAPPVSTTTGKRGLRITRSILPLAERASLTGSPPPIPSRRVADMQGQVLTEARHRLKRGDVNPANRGRRHHGSLFVLNRVETPTTSLHRCREAQGALDRNWQGRRRRRQRRKARQATKPAARREIRTTCRPSCVLILADPKTAGPNSATRSLPAHQVPARPGSDCFHLAQHTRFHNEPSRVRSEN